MKNYFIYGCLLVILGMCPGPDSVTSAAGASASILLAPGWNIVSTPKVLESHSFSIAETSTNFDIYVLDASTSIGWATMADLGQSEFEPLYGYFIHNKTGSYQTLVLNYRTNLAPNEKLFGRTFSEVGWYSIGIANDTYAVPLGQAPGDTNNPSAVLSLMTGKYDLAIDFTNAKYSTNRQSVAVSDPWKAVIPSDINTLNDFRERKGYAIYVKEAGATYSGFQNDASTTTDEIPDPPATSDEILVRTSSNDPDATTLKVEDDSKSDWLSVFMFDIDTDDSSNNIELNTVAVTLDLSHAYNLVVDDAELVIDGTTVDDFEVSSTTVTNPTLTFDVDGDVTVAAGNRVGAEFNLRFKALAVEGTTVKASVSGNGAVTGSGSENVESVGAATGNMHTLRSRGLLVTLDDDSANVTAGESAGDDYATFRLTLEVTAFEQDAFISTDKDDSIDADVVNSSGVASAGITTVVIDSSADVEGGSFRISEGETETVTITVTFDAATAGAVARLQLHGLTFGEFDGDLTQEWTALPASDFRTDIVTLVN